MLIKMPSLLGSLVAGYSFFLQAHSVSPYVQERPDFFTVLEVLWAYESHGHLEENPSFQGLPSAALASLPDVRDSVWASAGSQSVHELGQAHHWIPFTSWQPVNPVECLWLGTQRYHIHLDFHPLCTAVYKCGWAHFWAGELLVWSCPTPSFSLEEGSPRVSVIASVSTLLWPHKLVPIFQS